MKTNLDILENEIIEKFGEFMEVFLQWKHLKNQQITLPDPTEFKRYRAELGLSLNDVAKNTGLSTSTVHRVENGKNSEYSSFMKLFNYYSKVKGNNNQLAINEKP